jgi:hypothetical protein
VFVDVIPVSALLYIINFANCYQSDPQKARKEAKEEKVNYAHYAALFYYEKVR